MTSHETTETPLLRRYLRAWEERDRDAIMDLIAEDATWHVFGGSNLAGTVEGRDAIWERFFEPLWDTPTNPELHDILENDEHTVGIGAAVFELPDGEHRFKTVEVYHHRDGQLTERWFFTDRRSELDEVLDRMTG